MQDEQKQAYEVDIDNLIPIVNPTLFGVGGKVIRPRDYFITSGDAIAKSRVLLKDIFSYTVSQNNDLRLLAMRAAECTSLVIEKLETWRGDAIFMETEWNDHKLLCIPKNPRKRKPIEKDI